jgi:hypothetical protein
MNETIDTPLSVFVSKQQTLLDTINKSCLAHDDSTQLITESSLYGDKSGDGKHQAKQFLTHVLKCIKYFHVQSSAAFKNSPDYPLYKGIIASWGVMDVSTRTKVWVLLSEMFVSCSKIFPIIKSSNYEFIRIVFYLESNKSLSDIEYTIPVVTDIIIGCVSKLYARINSDIEKGDISTSLVERIGMEFEMDNIKDWEKKINSVTSRPEIVKILDTVSEYVTEPIKIHVHKNVKNVIDGEPFRETFRTYTKKTLSTMFYAGEINFDFLKRVVVDSGMIVLFGDEAQFPTSFKDLTVYIQRRTGFKISEEDAHSFVSSNVSNIRELPQFGQMCDKLGMNNKAVDAILRVFNLNDLEGEKQQRLEEKNNRKEKRMRKKLKKLRK